MRPDGHGDTDHNVDDGRTVELDGGVCVTAEVAAVEVVEDGEFGGHTELELLPTSSVSLLPTEGALPTTTRTVPPTARTFPAGAVTVKSEHAESGHVEAVCEASSDEEDGRYCEAAQSSVTAVPPDMAWPLTSRALYPACHTFQTPHTIRPLHPSCTLHVRPHTPHPGRCPSSPCRRRWRDSPST